MANLFVHDDHVFIGDYKNRKTIVLFGNKMHYINGKTLYNDPQSRIFWNEITKQVFVINKGNIYISQYVDGKLSLKKLLYYKDFDKEFYYSMYYDQEYQKLYLGTFTKGLNIITISNFGTSIRNKPFDDNVFYSAIPYSKHSVITSEGTEYFRDKSKVVYEESTLEKVAIVYDNSGNIIYIKDYTIQKRDKKDRYQKVEPIHYDDKNALFLFNTEGLYTASFRGASKNYLYFFEGDNFKKVKNVLTFETNIMSVAKIGNDTFYVGCRDGLYLVSISKNKIISKIIGDVAVRQIIKTKDQNIWITTANNGFYLIKNNKAIRMPEDKNNYLSQAHHILEDSKSNLWITSNEGLFKIRKKMLLDYANSKKTSIFYYRYTKEYGFLTNEFNGAGNITGNELEDGQFVFPSLEGLVFFKPNEVKSFYPKANEAFIERGSINNKTFFFSKNLILKSNYENLVLYIDIPYYYNFDNIRLEAKLTGDQDIDWKEVSESRQYAVKNNLEPGEYKLIVRYLISDDGQFEYKTVPITILPFFYQTSWFKFCILLLIGSIISFVFYRDRKLKKELESKNTSLEKTTNQLKNQTYYQKELLSSISHDITTPLKFITNLSKQLKKTEDLETQKEYFESISKSSEQLYKFTRELSKYSELFSEENVYDSKEYFLSDLIEDKKMIFKEIANQKGILLENLTEPNLKSTINKNILGAILHNLIDNAVKYTSKGGISVKSLETDSNIKLLIIDSGRQMSDEQIKYYSSISVNQENENNTYKNYGLGLHMVIQLIRKIKAKIDFDKNVPMGMVITITLEKNENV